RAKGAIAVGDVFSATDLAKDAENERQKRLRPPRLDRLAELLVRPGLAQPATAVAILRDRRGRADTKLPFGSAAAIDDFRPGHVGVIDATGMFLWVGDGPGAAGELRPFDLRHELGGEAVREALTFSDEAGVDVDAARAVVAARRHVREGMRLYARQSYASAG